MKLNDYASALRTRGNYKVPHSVQQSIPIDHIYADGIWKSGDVYSMMWCLSDINYNMLSDQDKKLIQLQYGALYASLPADCWAKFCIVSQRMDEQEFRRDILFHRANDGMDELRGDLNRQMVACAQNQGSVIQHKYLIVSTNKKNIKDAQVRLQHVRGQLVSAFSGLKCTFRDVLPNDRLQILHNFFRMGEENHFHFALEDYTRLGNDFRDAIAPDTISFKSDHIEFDGHFAKCMSLDHYPQKLDDQLITTLLRQVPYIVLSIDVTPVEMEDAYRAITDGRMKVDADKVRFNRKSVDNLDFTSSMPRPVQDQDHTINKYETDMNERDQQMFLSLLTVAYFADSLEDLTAETEVLKTAAVNMNCRFTELKWQQENAFNTAMPYGLRRIENMKTMMTEGVAALIPFSTQEVMHPHGVFYGRNAVSGNLIVGKRTQLVNGNAIIIGTSGSGKSFITKYEMAFLRLRNSSAKFYVVDPEAEYSPLVNALGGTVINISAESSTFFNPLDFVYDPSTKVLPHVAKAEFILSLCEQIMDKENVHPGDNSLIDRSLKNIYKPLVRSGYTAACPTLTDLWQDLQKQNHPRAQEIALALEIFTTGSLNMFAKPTNVDMKNNLICFNIQSLGDKLKPIAMLSMLEFINTCVMRGDRSDPNAATWVYFDEIYLLLRDKLSADFLFSSWKRYRKYNAYATGITQNLQDCLTNDTAYAMLANSEFVCMLRQTKDIDSVVELYGLSEHQRNYLLTAGPGQGILKMGNALVQFENKCPAESLFYKKLTTKPGE